MILTGIAVWFFLSWRAALFMGKVFALGASAPRVPAAKLTERVA